MKETKQGYCMYCNKHTKVEPLISWNNQKVIYFCVKHIAAARDYDSESKRKFFEYYRSEETQNWLSSEQKSLWKKINKEYNQ